jgi:hypothetical protein
MNELSSEHTPVAAALPPPPYQLYDYRSVGLASFLGTPLGGSVLMAMNYRRLGNRASAAGALAVGIVATSLLLLLGFSGIASTGVQIIGLLAFIGMMQGAKAIQGFEIQEHVRLGGRLASKGSAAITGLVCLAAVAAVVFGIVEIGTVNRTKIMLGADEVYYSGDSTAENARAFGEALKTVGYLRGSGATVEIAKDKATGVTLSFVVQDGTWDDADKVSKFQDVGRLIAPAVGGLPFELRFLDTSSKVKKQVTVR